MTFSLQQYLLAKHRVALEQDIDYQEKSSKQRKQDAFREFDVGGLDVQPKPDEETETCLFKCYMRCLNKDFALAVILPAKLPLGVACYIRNQIAEFVHANIELGFYTFLSQMKVL